MRAISFFSGLLLAWVAAPVAWGTDLAKLDRGIVKEPAYESKPKYCLLVFGPEAKTRVWLVLEGGTLHVDRNGNGDLTDEKERLRESQSRVFTVGAIPVPSAAADDKSTYTNLQLTVPKDFATAKESGASIAISIDGQLWRAAIRRLADRPQDAPIVHLGGPVTFLLEGPNPTLVRGRVSTLSVHLGTAGLGTGTFAWRTAREVVPSWAAWEAEVEYPNREPGGKPQRLKATVAADQCCGCTLGCTLRIPGDAGPGNARITFSLPDWREIKLKVNPATFELPITAPQVE